MDLAAAGIEYADASGRVVDLHALRATFGTTLARCGVTLQGVVEHLHTEDR